MLVNKEQLKAQLNSIRQISNPQEMTKRLCNFAYSCGIPSIEEMYYESIAEKSEVCKAIACSANKRNLESIRIMTKDISDWSADYFKINGYGNYETLSQEFLLILISDLEDVIDEE